jgi:ribosomal-protein-alanine N-acetyltransferase
LGFAQANAIETYVKEDRELPDVVSVPELTIRQVYSTDFAALARLEEISFAPIWRYSAQALAIARPQSLSFDVALLADEIVGYQLSANAEAGAHLVRITVHPQKHGLGIGSALLKHAFAYYHRQGLYTVSLNTQVENIASQKLYLKFGFRPSQQRLPIWILDIL